MEAVNTVKGVRCADECMQANLVQYLKNNFTYYKLWYFLKYYDWDSSFSMFSSRLNIASDSVDHINGINLLKKLFISKVFNITGDQLVRFLSYLGVNTTGNLESTLNMILDQSNYIYADLVINSILEDIMSASKKEIEGFGVGYTLLS